MSIFSYFKDVQWDKFVKENILTLQDLFFHSWTDFVKGIEERNFTLVGKVPWVDSHSCVLFMAKWPNFDLSLANLFTFLPIKKALFDIW